jgi:hypothetical protein
MCQYTIKTSPINIEAMFPQKNEYSINIAIAALKIQLLVDNISCLLL